MTTGFVDEPRLAGLMLREAVRRLASGLRAGVRRPAFPGVSQRGAILAVPQELRRGDASIARGFYVGQVWLAGHLVDLSGRSPFLLKDAPRAWTSELNAFDWLRHFSQAGDALSAEHVRALIGDWLRVKRRHRPRLAYEHDTAARRVLAWYTHSPIILARADAAFAQRFARGLEDEVRRLRRTANSAPDGVARLRVRMALATAALCQPGPSGAVKLAARQLGDELDRQIYPDGGHISRNPAAILAILADLLPLRQLFVERAQPVPRALFSAVDRMLPALRFFRHGDGSLALFNGAGVPDNYLVAGLLRHDETLGEPISQMRQSGYQRLAAGLTVLLADTGVPPAPAVSSEAHAGTLAFEFSAGGRRFVVNCGAPLKLDGGWRRLSRTTAAHSTLTLNDHSSSRFSKSDALDRFLGGPLMPGPTRVPTNREDTRDGQILTAAHDGYRQGFGLVHERQLALSRDGRRIEGTDRLFHAAGRSHRLASEEPMGILRFHLHPDVKPENAGEGIRLACAEEIWWFFGDGEAEIEDSIFFADGAGPRRSKQITLAFDCLDRGEVSWRFERQR